MSFHSFSSFLPRGGGGQRFPDFPGGQTLDDIFRFVEPFLPTGGGGGPPQPQQTPRPDLPMPGDFMGPRQNGGGTFGTCRNTRGTKMPPSIADNGQLCCPPGFHLSRTKDPCTGNSASCCVKNRRMDFQNGRAFNRAVRRVRGKAKQDKRARRAIGDAAREMGCYPNRRK